MHFADVRPWRAPARCSAGGSRARIRCPCLIGERQRGELKVISRLGAREHGLRATNFDAFRRRFGHRTLRMAHQSSRPAQPSRRAGRTYVSSWAIACVKACRLRPSLKSECLRLTLRAGTRDTRVVRTFRSHIILSAPLAKELPALNGASRRSARITARRSRARLRRTRGQRCRSRRVVRSGNRRRANSHRPDRRGRGRLGRCTPRW